MSLCNALWVAKYEHQWIDEPHHHDFFHLQAILGGVACIRIDEEEWMVQSEQIYLIPPHAVHNVSDRSGGKVPLRMYDVKFSVYDMELYHELSELPRPCMIENFTQFASQMEMLLDESYMQQPYSLELINARFTLVIVDIVKQFRKESPRPGNLPVEGEHHFIVRGIDMPKLLKYIRSNIGRVVTLDLLAQVAGINKTTLTEVFKKCYGVTPMRYVNQLRLMYAKEMLVNSDAGIGDIARSVGFTNHYFSRYFRSQLQCTPQEYRNRHANNRFYSLSGIADPR